MTNELHQPDENTGTMEVLERHQFDTAKLKDYMNEHVEGFEGDIKAEEIITHSNIYNLLNENFNKSLLIYDNIANDTFNYIINQMDITNYIFIE